MDCVTQVSEEQAKKAASDGLRHLLEGEAVDPKWRKQQLNVNHYPEILETWVDKQFEK